jgi:hypothetical protein
MKQDSYPRFIKSEMYKVYLMREIEGKPLQLPKVEGEDQAGKGKNDKKKTKDKQTEVKEKRRRSLLLPPWKKSSKSMLKLVQLYNVDKPPILVQL